MNEPDGIGALLGVVLGVLGYYLLASLLTGAAPWPGLALALVFSLIGVAGAGNIGEGLVLGALLTAVVAFVFGVGSAPPPFFGHGLLALTTGLVAGNIAGSIPFGLMGPDPTDPDPPTSDVAPAGSFALYDSVEIVRLTMADRWWSEGADGIARPPRVRDQGVIVSVDEVASGTLYTVEIFDSDSNTICVAEALEEELAPA